MTKNPFVNALAAILYIALIALVMTWGGRMAPKDQSFLAPVAAMSLFTFSAALMGYLFCYQPGVMYFDGKKKEAVKLFLQTVGIFGGITILILVLLFSGVFL